MKKAFYMSTIIVIMITMITSLRSDPNLSNEDHEWETRFVKKNKVWRVEQVGSDSEDSGDLSTTCSNMTQQSSLIHSMNASARYSSDYVNPNVKGTWFLRAKLQAEWATDEEPFEDEGEIEGKKGGMRKDENQYDSDFFASRDPVDTISLTDSYARADVRVKGKLYMSKAYSHFATNENNIEYIDLRR